MEENKKNRNEEYLNFLKNHEKEWIGVKNNKSSKNKFVVHKNKKKKKDEKTSQTIKDITAITIILNIVFTVSYLMGEPINILTAILIIFLFIFIKYLLKHKIEIAKELNDIKYDFKDFKQTVQDATKSNYKTNENYPKTLNDIIKEKINQNKTNEKYQQKQKYTKAELKAKGDAYEYFVGNYYKNRGYTIYYQGINQGYKDYGIDIVAYQGDIMLLIQCKNWSKYKISKKVLDKFDRDCERYIHYHQNQTKYKSVYKVFAVSNNNITKEAQDKIFSIDNDIEFIHLPFK